MIDKQKLLEWLYEERCNAQRQLDVREVGDSNWYEYRGRTTAFNYVIYYVNSMPGDEPLQAEPKFRVGDRVRMAKGLFENQTGKITDMYYSFEIKTDGGANVIADEPYFELEPVEDEPLPETPRFKVGDRVRATDGSFLGEIATVTEETTGTSTRVKFDNGTKIYKNTDYLELLQARPTVKITGAEAFVESAKQLIKALEALEVEIDDADTD